MNGLLYVKVLAAPTARTAVQSLRLTICCQLGRPWVSGGYVQTVWSIIAKSHGRQ